MTIDTIQNNKDNFAVLPADGDGGPQDLKETELQKFKTELNHIARSSGWNVNERRAAAEETRFCLWPGQSPDGRKHQEAQDGKPAWPWEGASDVRLRLADMVINERVMVLTAAALRNRPTVQGLELNNAALGHKLGTVLNWVLANKLGVDYVREIVKLASYQESDSPAAAILGAWWEQEFGLELQSISIDELGQLLIKTYGQTPEQVAALEVQLYNPQQDAATAEALQQLIEHLTPARARTMVKELRETGRAEYPCPYLRRDQPCLVTYRLMEDCFIPANTTNLQRSRCIYLREWLTEVELRGRIISHRWTEDFVDAVLKHEGQSGFPIYRRGPAGDLQPYLTQETADDRRGLYEVFTVVFRAANVDNIPGLYYLPFHTEVKAAAHERRLLEFAHGQYPFTWFGREYITQRLMDSRGVPELAATEQYNQKLLTDAFNDATSLDTVPPLLMNRGQTKKRLIIRPLAQNYFRPGDVEYLERKMPPRDNRIAYEESTRRVNEYFGRLAETVPATLTQMHMQHMVTLFLASLTEALTQVLQLCQQFISDEELEMICGDDGVPIARSRQEIQGKFRVELSFDARHLDTEYLQAIAEMIKNLIVPMDTQNTVMRDQLIRFLFQAINPWLASKTLAPAQGAQQQEVEDEKKNLSQIQTSIEPPMLPEGQNFGLRLETMLSTAETNPEYLAKLTPVAADIFRARLEYLYHQVEQAQNAQIGRQVGQPVFGSPQMMQLKSRVQRLLGDGKKTSNTQQ